MSIATLQRIDAKTPSKDLVGRAKAGDRQAAEQLVEETYEFVFASLVRLTGGDRDLAADLCQEAYRRAWQSLSGFSGRSKITTWLYRIAYTTFLNHIRRPQLVQPFEDEEEQRVVDPSPSAAESTEGRLFAGNLRRCVMKLPEELRFAVTAHFWAELSVKEIARLQGVTQMGVRKRLKRAYRHLDVLLEQGAMGGES